MSGSVVLATDILKAEHKQIVKVLELLDAIANKMELNQEVKPQVFDKAIFFMRYYVDYVHHVKEEDYLFGVIKGAPNPGKASASRMSIEATVSVLYTEHEQGRACLRKIISAVQDYNSGNKEEAKDKVIGHVRDYVELLKKHVAKEDDHLFPMANILITSEINEELLKDFKDKNTNQRVNECISAIDEIRALL